MTATERGTAPDRVCELSGALPASGGDYEHEPPQRTAVAYLRVSTDVQVEGFGLDVQDQTVRAWCATAGVTLLEVYRDEGVSGSLEIGARSGLSMAVADVVDGCVSMLVVPKLDRLARSLTVQEAVLSQVWRAGGTVVACDVGEIPRDDPDDPMRTFVRQVMGAVSELERGMIRARTRAGRRRKAALGGYAGGAPPYGWIPVNRELEPVESEQVVIARAVELAGSMSLRKVATALNAEGHRTRKGGLWQMEQVRRILGRQAATGVTANGQNA